MNQFQVGKNNISYIGIDFKEWFGDVKCKKTKCEYTKTELKTELKESMNDSRILKEIKPNKFTTELKESMNDSRILKEIKPNKFTLGEILYLLPKLDKSEWNIFYCEDKNGVLRAVYVFWFADGWNVYAYSVENPHAWHAGHQVFSCNSSSEPLTSDSLTLEKRVSELEDQMDRLRKFLII